MERATRLCSTSPQIATFRPAMRPKARRMESASRRAWVGCSCWPSPALITEQVTFCDRRLAAPDEAWRITSKSGCMAFNVTAVSIRVSPLEIDEERGLMFTTSAPSRLPASSKELWVRVEFSKNRFIRVRPFRRSSFFEVWRLSDTKPSARSSSPATSTGLRSSTDRKCRRGNGKVLPRTSFRPGGMVVIKGAS
ncbi:hypothetical protein GALL_504850 [mine drainage metagenome]|uniref:Uncharacterized protein n=1 Tax=mine drainage metagenome TaxID=410659 RepID=A0A1J5PK46_9ZZZZ